MGSVGFGAAKVAASVSSWGLRKVFHRPAGNFPGKLALYLDGNLIGDLRSRCEKGSVLVVGTNGKTTVTNLLADCLQEAGQRVICNRGGANLASGIATSLLAAEQADWGVFEVDELWLAKVAPGLQPSYVLLLDLFRDQLDRMGEIDTIAQSILKGLAASPGTILVYNADDPNCAAIARAASNKSVAFGVEGSLGLPQPSCETAQMCTQCASMLSYEYRQYDQLGSYQCPTCGFSRPVLDYAAASTSLNAGGIGMDIRGRHVEDSPVSDLRLHARWTGAYMVYNLLAVATGALLAGCSLDAVQRAVDAFDPKNGRLQWVRARGRDLLLNLAKNPVGFNQNLQIILQDGEPCAAAFFVNDAEGDGRDPSWIWNVDFEALAARPDIAVFVGGTRALELALRLKYAGVAVRTVETAGDVLDALGCAGACGASDARVYIIANYTALPPLREELVGVEEAGAQAPGRTAAMPATTAAQRSAAVPVPEVAAGTAAPAAPSAAAVACAADAAAADSADVAAADSPAGTAGSSGSAAVGSAAAPADPVTAAAAPAAPAAPGPGEPPLVIVHVFPELLGVFGDGGNVRVLAQRLRWRGIPCEVRAPRCGEAIDLDCADLVFVGGSMGRELTAAARALGSLSRKMQQFAQRGGVVFGVSGGFQMFGQVWTMEGRNVSCLGLLEAETREDAGSERLLGDIALNCPLAATPVVGFANHTGTARTKPSIEPFGTVIAANGTAAEAAKAGKATRGAKAARNTPVAAPAAPAAQAARAADGAIAGNVMGTYLHGPVLAKNPELADELLRRALAHRASRTGAPAPALAPLDDRAEQAANAYICARLGV